MEEISEYFSEHELKEMRRVFYDQAYEIVESLQDALLELESSEEDEIMKTVKRHVHTLKGDAYSFGLQTLGTLCHRIEDMFFSMIDGPHTTANGGTDLLLQGVDLILRLLEESEAGREMSDISRYLETIDAFLNEGDGETQLLNNTSSTEVTEYQELQARDALQKGLTLYDLDIIINPECGNKAEAVSEIFRRLNESGTVIRTVPDFEQGDLDGVDRLAALIAAGSGSDEIREKTAIEGITDSISVRRSKLHTQGEHAGHEQAAPVSPVRQGTAQRGMLRIDASRVDRIMNLVGELIIGRSMIDRALKDLESGAEIADVKPRLSSANASMDRTVTDLQRGVMKLRMVPVNHVFRKFPKMVRDLAVEKEKTVLLEVQGRETELDKSIVDALGEPLAHIIRNMIDHGIEDAEGRKAAGKPEEAVITLRAFHESAQIVIEVSDDGRGIDTEKLKRKAIEKGILGSDEAEKITGSDALDLIFVPGLSTAGRVSDTSGRGIGMDVVRSTIESMKGIVEVGSEPGMGSRFTLRLPLTLAIIKALLVEVSGSLYALPLSAIAEVTRIEEDDLITVDGKTTLMLRGNVISVLRIAGMFGLTEETSTKKFVLVLGFGGKKIGLLVDGLIGQQELVIKAVDGEYARSDVVAGASILGDGKVVFILDALSVFRNTVEREKIKFEGVMK